MNLKTLAKLAIGIGLVVAIVQIVGIEKMVDALAQFDLAYFIPLILLFIASLVISALNLKLIADLFRVISFREALSIVVLSFAATLFSPGRIGQFSQVYLLKNKGLTIGQGTATVIADKVLTLVVLSFFASLSVIFFLPPDYGVTVLGGLVVGWIGLFFFLYSETGRNLIKKFILRKYRDIFTGFKKAIDEIVAQKQRVFWDLVLSAVRLLVTALTTQVAILGLGGNAFFPWIILISAATQILSFIPITPNGLGVKEGGFAVMATFIGIPLGVATIAIFIMTILNYAFAGIVSLLFLEGRIFDIEGKKPEKQVIQDRFP